MERRVERVGGMHRLFSLSVCFRAVLKGYPFISTYVLVSVFTQREARRALSHGDLQQIVEERHVVSPVRVVKWSY